MIKSSEVRTTDRDVNLLMELTKKYIQFVDASDRTGIIITITIRLWYRKITEMAVTV